MAEFTGLRALVIDDSAHTRHIIRTILSEMGAEVKECEDGRAGLATLLRWPADVILVDYEMKPISGAEFTRELRARERSGGARTPVLMVTGHGDRDRVMQARAAGVDGLVAKPLTIGSLVDRLAKVLPTARRRSSPVYVG